MRRLPLVLALAALALIGVVAALVLVSPEPSDSDAAAAAASRKAAAEEEEAARAAAKGAGKGADGGHATDRARRAGSRAIEAGEGAVAGVVLDFDGNPAAGVKIRILPRKGGIPIGPADAETDSQGRFFAIEPVKGKKSIRLRAQRRDRLPITLGDVIVRNGESTDLGILRFEPSGSLDVTVLDSDSRPVPNVRVLLERSGESPPKENVDDPADAFDAASALARRRRTTGEDGIARFEAVAAGATFVRLETPEVGRKRSPKDEGGVRVPPPKTVGISAGRNEQTEFALRGLGTLTGVVRVAGQPLAGEWLKLSPALEPAGIFAALGRSVRAKTDGEGRFAFPPVAPATYVLGKGSAEAGPHLEDLEDSDDYSAAGMRWLSSTSEGSASSQHDLARTVEVREGLNTVDLEIGGSLVEVFVQDADDAAPIPGATVRLFDRQKDGERPEGALPFARAIDASGGRAVRLRGTADARGRAEFRDLEPGRYRVIARLEDRPPSTPVDVEVVSGGSFRAAVRIPKSTSVSGSVSDARGRPLEDAIVTAVLDRTLEPPFPDDLAFLVGPPTPTAFADAKGAFRMKGLESGRHRLVAYLRGYSPTAIDVTSPSDGHSIFLSKPGSLRVTVKRGGKPEAGVLVRIDIEAADAPIPWNALRAAGGPLGIALLSMGMNGMTDAEGTVVLKDLPPGSWTLLATRASRAAEPPTAQRATVSPEVETAVKIDL